MGTEWQELYTWYRQNPKWRKKIEQIVEACFYEKPKDGLTTRTAQRLYGTILENSVTRLEKFSACAYAHFLSYGLNLREREEYTFQAIDLGNISIVPLNILQKNWRRRGTHGRRFRK